MAEPFFETSPILYRINCKYTGILKKIKFLRSLLKIRAKQFFLFRNKNLYLQSQTNYFCINLLITKDFKNDKSRYC